MTTQPDRVAQVIAWLRELALLHRPFGLVQGDPPSCALEYVADAIEAGEPFKETPDA